MKKVVTYILAAIYFLLALGVWLIMVLPVWISDNVVVNVATALFMKGWSIPQILKGFWTIGFISGLVTSPLVYAVSKAVYGRLRTQGADDQ